MCRYIGQCIHGGITLIDIHVWQMCEHWGCLESTQQNAVMRWCDHMECFDSWTCWICARLWKDFNQATAMWKHGTSLLHDCRVQVLVEGHLNAACTIYKLAVSQISSWVTALWTCRPFIWEHRGCLENVQDNEHKFLRIPYFVDFWATEDRHKVLELYAWRQEGEGKEEELQTDVVTKFLWTLKCMCQSSSMWWCRYVHQ
jgi:hypothetical protein